MTRWISTGLLAAALAGPAAGQNLLANPAFDAGLAGWTSGNTTWVASAGNPAGSGPGCAEVVGPLTNGGLYATWQTVAVEVGVQYQISGWAYVADVEDNIADGSELAINWVGASGSLGYSWFPISHVRGQWSQIVGQATAPAGAISAQPSFGVRVPTSGSGTPRARWDDLYFGPVQTGAATTDLFVLAAGYGPGKKETFWTTDVSVFNATTSTLAVEATFFQGTSDNSGARPVSLGSLAAGATETIANVVRAAGGSGTGAVRLRFTAPAGATNATAVVTARTWTAWAGASIGQGAVAVLRPYGTARAVSGLVENAASRTNVGVFNTTANPVSARVRIYDALGTVVYDQTWGLGPFGQSQVGLPSLGVTAIEGGTLRVDGAGVLAYATPVDNLSGDAAFLQAQPIE